MIDHAIQIVTDTLAKYPAAYDMPLKIDYGIGMLARNVYVWCLFRYIKPEKISMDYLDLLMTRNSSGFF